MQTLKRPNKLRVYILLYISVAVCSIETVIDGYIYDLNGKFVESIYSGSFTPGEYSFSWTPQNISSGKYFVSFKSNEVTDVKELIYIK